MRKFTLGLVAMSVAGLAIGTAFSEPPEDGNGPPRGREGRPERGEDRRGPGPGGPPGGFRHGGPPLMMALDTDKDGEISAEEIANASASLKALDKNDDGKLTREEIHPRPAGRRGGPGEGRPGEGRPDRPGEGRRGQFGPGRPGEDGGPGQPGRRGPGQFDFSQRFAQFDKNNDGKLTKDEIPERMQRILDKADENGDGALDKDELKKMAERFKNREGRGPEGRRPPGEEGRRPRKPTEE